MARLLALCSLPRTNQGDRLQYVRRNGPYTLVMTATGLHKLPYGTLPASRTVPPWSESKAKGNSLSPVSRDTLTPGKRRVAAPCRQRQRVTSRGSRFSSRSTRRSVSSLSVLTSIAPVSAVVLACRVSGRDLRRRVQTVSAWPGAPSIAIASRPAGTLPLENSDSAFENTWSNLAYSGAPSHRPRDSPPSRAAVPSYSASHVVP